VSTTIQAVEWDAEDYAAHSQGQYRWGLNNLDRLLLSGTECVLDVGSGDGKLTAEIARRVPGGRVVGVDNAPAMVEFASLSCAESQSNVSFVLGDAQALDFDAEFDIAFSNSTLHWVPDHPAVLRGLFRALKPGGRIYLSMSGRGTAAVVLSVIHELAQHAPWRTWLDHMPVPWYFFGSEEYRIWLHAAGFILGRVELVPRIMRQQGVAGVESWLRTAWMPYTDRVPEDDRALFVTEVAHGVAERCGASDDGSILLPMVNLEIEARKPVK
jgi:trans-aconitate methyltransferase